ncbi:MAG TPA: hypothetical protein PK956_04540 [Burkholderiaceae bacterium]|jgi:hypothetical protein|nr:hypothetical protein [Burkholderiaceae bacterium]
MNPPRQIDATPGTSTGAGGRAMEAGGLVNYILLGIVWLVYVLHKA